ncbi:hypothetical protein BGZ60DRAFT_431555 [Tricladium varicosporioides]|nr:hypothetical protein BGZ60DRAFT_431555 [Hymenoscyphus varicosporioides]
MTTPPPRRIFLITGPRTASNLLVKILAPDSQPEVQPAGPHGGYYFLPAVLAINQLHVRGKHVDEWTEDERTKMMHAYQAGLNNLEAYTREAESNGKIAFVKEHANMFFGPQAGSKLQFPGREVKDTPWVAELAGKTERSVKNETLIPDELLKSFTPAFLIRNPVLAFPSFLRTMVKLPPGVVSSVEAELPIGMTLTAHRSMYEFYADLYSKEPKGDGESWPLVLDADDVINNQDIVIRMAELLGLDSSKLQFSWEAKTKEQIEQTPAIWKVMLSSLDASHGILPEKAASSQTLDIDVEAKKWKEEFGEERGTTVERLVREAMPDYEYLNSKRMRLKGEKST